MKFQFVSLTVLIAALFACGQPTVDTEPFAEADADTDTDADSDADTDTDTDDTDSDTDTRPLRDIGTLFIDGWFGYDNATGTVVPVTIGGIATPSTFNIYLGAASYLGDKTDTNRYCTVTVDLDDYTGEPFAITDGYLFGFMIPQAIATGSDDCEAKSFDTSGFAGGDPLTDWGFNGGFGLEIGGDPSDIVSDWLVQVGIDPLEYDLYGGGYLLESVGLPDAGDAIYWRAWEVDAQFEVDDLAPMDRYAWDDGNGGLATGYYAFGMVYYWNIS